MLDSLRAQWLGLSSQVRTLLLIVAPVVVLTGVMAAVFLGQGNRYVPLYSGLSATQEGAVVARLTAQGVPYQLSGGSLMVPQGVAPSVRMALAAAGLPGQSPQGLSALSKLPFTASQTQQQAALLAAMQGEMEQSINTLQGVNSSAVRIVLGQQSPYLGQSVPATASVVLTLAPGVQLTKQQVGAIQSLVAFGVPGLLPSKVAVVDQYGNLLSQGQGLAGSTGGVLPKATLAEQQYDTTLGQQLQQMLDRVYGAGNAVVQVASVLNMNKVSSTRKAVTAPIATSVKTLKETWSGTAPGVAGVPGATTNTPTYGVPAVAAGAAGNGTLSDTATGYASTTTTTKTVTVPGAVTSLSVSVALNAKLTAAQQTQVRTLVLSALALPAATVTVLATPFAKVPVPAVVGKRLLNRTEMIVGGAMLAVILLLLLLLLRRRKPDSVDAPASGGMPLLPAEVRQESNDLLEKVRDGSNADLAAIVNSWMEQSDRPANGR